MAHALFVLAILPCVLSTSTIPANRLFQNTLKRWGITILNDKDRSERWNRFIKAKATVDRTTSGVILESLNHFTVLNNIEYEARVGPYRRRLNASTFLLGDIAPRELDRRKRAYTVVDIPDTYTYWEDEVGLVTPINQHGCGSCWSFPTVGTIEALYKEYTGEMAEFSQQYFVDCTFAGDGCGGGSIDDGYKITMMRQYMLSYTKAPYEAYYQGCLYADEIISGEFNALTKVWVADTVPLSTNENAMLNGLQTSPVAFGSYVSSDIFDYSGGSWTDSSCSSDPNAHAMLLVGYTETILRVKASYGSDYGDGGYINYVRGTATLESCNFYKDSFALKVTYRRELEYAWCNDQKVGTRGECKSSCSAMDTETETGWSLATIPTEWHNTYLANLADAAYTGVKDNDKFDLYWMGLKDVDQDSNYAWEDGSAVKYMNTTGNVAKYGMLDKNTGYWYFKNSLSFDARGFCSRATTCWDIGMAVENGDVTFDRTTLTEGTVGTVTCDDDYSLNGTETLTCVGGWWNADLPNCVSTAGPLLACDKPTIDSATLDPDTDTIESSSSYTVTCATGFALSGDSAVLCSNGSLSTLPTCEESEVVCSKPSIANANLAPTTDTIDPGSNYTVTCEDDFVMTGSSVVNCSDDGTLSDLPSCAEGSKCTAPTIGNGTVSPTTAISDGEAYTATCDSGYEIDGSDTVNCTLDEDNAPSLSDLPICEEIPTCSIPAIGNGTVEPADKIVDGDVYTVSCSSYYYMEGSENMTCTVTNGTGTLSEAPTCIQETCNETYAIIENGEIIGGEKNGSYVYGDKVIFDCNDNYVMEGNKYIDCKGSYWSSSAPTCTAINLNCTDFTVDAGYLGNYYPYFTNDTVRVSCKTDYVFAGENPRECRTAGWKNDAPTCTANDGNECISLTAPTNGNLACETDDDDGKMVPGTTCNVTCNDGYTSLGTFNETSCNQYLIWDHQSGSNSLAEFAPCIEMIPPAAKSLRNKVTILTEYCTTDAEVTKITAALIEFLNKTLLIPCIVASSCEVEDVTCVYRSATNKVKLKFSLTQTQDMIDTTLLKEAKVMIKKSVRNNQFELSVIEKRRKRRSTLSADADSLESEEEVTCPDEGQAVQDGVCVECPVGYKTFNDTCVACPVGTYNAATGAIACNDCEANKTTYGEGSTKEDQCYELCTVPEIDYGSLNVETGFKVEPTYTLNLTCDETFEASVSSFNCSTYSTENHTCNALNQCVSSVITLDNGTITGDEAPYDSGETVTFSCNAEYKLVGTEKITCVSRTWSRDSPVCTEINTNCATYDVENGDTDDDSSFVTGESASVECDYGYLKDGTDPRVCGESGWETDAQTCVKNEGTCLALEDPVNGTLTCTGEGISETCTVSCVTGYMSLDEYSEVECEDTLLWSHQSYSNSRGTFAPCVEVEEADSRTLEAEFSVSQNYCNSDDEESAVVTAFETHLASADVPCLDNDTCSIVNATCQNSDSTSITISFVLTQTGNMSDPSILTTADTYISELVDGESLAFDVTTSKKRATTTFTATADSYGASLDTDCADDMATVDDICYECPAGYKTSPSCTACSTGFYNTEAAESCQSCGDGLSTYGTGSTSSEDCVDLCEVPGVTKGDYSPPTGYNVDPATVVTLTCDTGYVASAETFICSTGDKTTCSEQDSTEAVKDDSTSTTVIVVVVLAVVIVLIIAAGVCFYFKKKQARSSITYKTAEAEGVPLQVKELAEPVKHEIEAAYENTYDAVDAIYEEVLQVQEPLSRIRRESEGIFSQLVGQYIFAESERTEAIAKI